MRSMIRFLVFVAAMLAADTAWAQGNLTPPTGVRNVSVGTGMTVSGSGTPTVTIALALAGGTCGAGTVATALSATGTLTCTAIGAAGGTTGTGTATDLAVWSSSTGLGNFAGSSPAACGAGNATTGVTLGATGALTNTCSSLATLGAAAGTGTLNKITKWSNTTGGLVDSSVLDDGTTFNINSGKFTVTEASGNTSVAGTLGVASTSTLSTTNINGSGLTATTNNNWAVFAQFTNTAVASSGRGAIEGTNTGTFNTTTIPITTYGGNFTVLNSLTAGANILTSIALYATNTSTASGTLKAIALQTDAGSVHLNAVNGTTAIDGNTTLGTTTANAHAVNGTVNFNATAGTNGQILEVVSGLPQWVSAATSGFVSGTGTLNKITKWSNTTGGLTDSSFTDIGSEVDTGANLRSGFGTGTGSVFASVGRDTSLTTNIQNGLQFQAFSDGNNYIDSKTYASGSTFFRAGAGAQSGATTVWLTVANTTGAATFGGDATISGNGGVNGNLTVGTTVGAVRVTGASSINYIESGINTTSGSSAPLLFTNMLAAANWGEFDASGNFLTFNNTTLGDTTADATTIWGQTTENKSGTTSIAGLTASNANMRAVDTETAAQGVGGSIVFDGAYTGTTTTEGAAIKLAKSNLNSGDYDFDLAFGSRRNGSSSMVEWSRLYADGVFNFLGGTSTTGGVYAGITQDFAEMLQVSRVRKNWSYDSDALGTDVVNPNQDWYHVNYTPTGSTLVYSTSTQTSPRGLSETVGVLTCTNGTAACSTGGSDYRMLDTSTSTGIADLRGLTVTHSVWVKMASGGPNALFTMSLARYNDGDTHSVNCTVNSTTWTRCSITATFSATSLTDNSEIRAYMSPFSTIAHYIYGEQVEQHDGPTPYQRTDAVLDTNVSSSTLSAFAPMMRFGTTMQDPNVWIRYFTNSPGDYFGVYSIGPTGTVCREGEACTSPVHTYAVRGDATGTAATDFGIYGSTGGGSAFAGFFDGKVGIINGALDMGSHQINSVLDPTSAQDAVTLHYMQAANGNHVSMTTVATTGTITNVSIDPTATGGIWFSGAGGKTLDGITYTVGSPADGDRVLLCENGGGATTLAHESASEPTAAGRFNNPASSTVLVTSGSCKTITYDGTLTRWRTHNEWSISTGAIAANAIMKSATASGTQLSASSILDGGTNITTTEPILVTNSLTGQAVSITGLSDTNNDSFNTTAGALTATAVQGLATGVVGSGANTLTDRAGYFSATGTTLVANIGIEANASGGASSNTALITDSGDVLLANTAGNVTIGAGGGSITIGGAGTVFVNSPVLQVASGSTATHWSYKDGTNRPTVANCGTTPTVVGDDASGFFTTTATPTNACAITFKTAFGSNVDCEVWAMTSNVNTTIQYTVATTGVTAITAVGGGALGTGVKVHWMCNDH